MYKSEMFCFASKISALQHITLTTSLAEEIFTLVYKCSHWSRFRNVTCTHCTNQYQKKQMAYSDKWQADRFVRNPHRRQTFRMKIQNFAVFSRFFFTTRYQNVPVIICCSKVFRPHALAWPSPPRPQPKYFAFKIALNSANAENASWILCEKLYFLPWKRTGLRPLQSRRFF